MEPASTEDMNNQHTFEQYDVDEGVSGFKLDPEQDPATSRKGCCGLPRGVTCCLWCLFGTAIFLIAGVAIAAPIVSIKAKADVPSLGYDQDSQVDYNQSVIIIGAGAAGLMAGYSLEYLGVKNYTILEADDQFGGRVRQLDDFVDVPLDLGAEWCHVHPKVLGDMLLFDREGKELPKMIDYRLDDVAVYKRGKVRYRNWFNWFYLDTKFKNTTWWGYFDTFVVPYVEEHLQLNTPVSLVDYTDPDLIRVVTTSGDVYTADQVIIATSVKILQEEVISFDPPLPEGKVNAINSVDIPPGLKAWIEFSEQFYPDLLVPGSMLDYAREDKLYFDALFKKGVPDQHVLAFFEVGATVGSKVVEDKETIIQKLLAELDVIFDGKASEYYVQSYVQNWSQKPYILGAYSYNGRDYSKKFGTLRASVDERLYFCGEYLAEEWSTVHGAAISGRNVVRRLMDDHGIQS